VAVTELKYEDAAAAEFRPDLSRPKVLLTGTLRLLRRTRMPPRRREVG
jgi:hypothetical protein